MSIEHKEKLLTDSTSDDNLLLGTEMLKEKIKKEKNYKKKKLNENNENEEVI